MSHEKLPLLNKRTVLVLEGLILFKAIQKVGSTIYRLKLDMQGHELSLLRNIQTLLKKETNLVTHIMAECFLPKQDGSEKQIYQVDNSCQHIAEVLQAAGYETQFRQAGRNREWTDIYAYNKNVADGFLSPQAWNGSN